MAGSRPQSCSVQLCFTRMQTIVGDILQEGSGKAQLEFLLA